MDIQRAWVFALGFLIAFAWVASFFGILSRPASLLSLAAVSFTAIIYIATKITNVGTSFRRTFRRLGRFPVWCWVGLSVVIFWGGATCMPSNYDALSYRIPRMLQWLSEGRIYWIDTPDVRQNVLGVTWELVALPLICIGGEGRFLFLVNFVAFLFMPGFVFSTLAALGLPGRSCWWGMWLLPTAYVVVLQAGGISSDLLAGLLFLASIRFALLFKNSGRLLDLLVSALAIGMVTGVKQLYLPLGLPWLVAIAPSVRLMLAKPTASMCALLAGACVSFAPTMALNFSKTGDPIGLKAFPQDIVNDLGAAGVGNALYFVGGALSPPVNPMGSQMGMILREALPNGIRSRIQATFEDGFRAPFPEIPIEELAGLGLLLSVSLIAWAIIGREKRKRLPVWVWTIFATTALCLILVMIKTGTATIGRYSVPHYTILAIPLLVSVPASKYLVGRSWRLIAGAVFAGAILVLAISPARQILPVGRIVGLLLERSPENRAFQRVDGIYSIFGQRGNAFGPVTKILPPETKLVGVWAKNSPIGTLWIPYGTKRVIEVDSLEAAKKLRAEGATVLILQEKLFHGEEDQTLLSLRNIWKPAKENEIRLRILAAVGDENFLIWE